jgi:hypothetical protein
MTAQVAEITARATAPAGASALIVLAAASAQRAARRAAKQESRGPSKPSTPKIHADETAAGADCEQAPPEFVHNGDVTLSFEAAPRLVARAIAGALVVVALGACESGQAKCARLQGAAVQAWSSYGQALQGELDAARSTRDLAKRKLEGDVHQRHELEARRQADQATGPEKSTAWYRTFLAAEQAQCAKDPECLELKVEVSQADETLAALTPRLAAVHAAERAAKSEMAAAQRAAEAVPPEPEARAVADAARAASAEAITACAK